MSFDAIIGKMLEGGAPYFFLAAVMYFVFKPPEWFKKIIDALIDNSKVRAASFERLLKAIHDLQQTLLLQLQVHERLAHDASSDSQELHKLLLMQIEKVGHIDRQDERAQMLVTLEKVVAEVGDARDFIIMRINELERATKGVS